MNWYQDWFGKEYLDLYAHRDANEAASQIDFVLQHAPCSSNASILDLACGNGRHLRALLERNFSNLYGLDLSEVVLSEAQRPYNNEQDTSQDAPTLCPPVLIRADMRHIPFKDSSFDLILNMFTSFGYFDTDEEHNALLLEWSRVLKPNGYLVLDYANRDFVLNNLVPETKTYRGKLCYVEQRRISTDGLRVIKRITVDHLLNGTMSEYSESVRLFGSEDIEQIAFNAGLATAKRFGDFSGCPLTQTSPRLILFLTKSGPL